MIFGRVIGELWCTRKHERLDARKLLLVQPYFLYAASHDDENIVAVDDIGAGVGDDVVVCLGTPARMSLGSVQLPVDAAVMAIVDNCQFEQAAFAPRSRRALRFLGKHAPNQVEWI